jgi:hypothetical protein
MNDYSVSVVWSTRDWITGLVTSRDRLVLV